MTEELTSFLVLSVGSQLVVESNVISLSRNRDGIFNVEHVVNSFTTSPTVLNLGGFTSIQVDSVKLETAQRLSVSSTITFYKYILLIIFSILNFL